MLLPRLRRALREVLWRLNPWRLHSQVLSRDASLAAERVRAVAVFNHFDADGRVAGYVLHHLDALRSLGLHIIFVTTSPRLNAAALDALRPRCWLVLQRPNVSLDLGGWPVAAAAVRRLTGRRVVDFERWLFTNDSIFGPMTPLPAVFATMAQRSPDAWGMTESLERRAHLQSYFMVFERPALDFLQRWLDSFQFILDREALISRYELGLSLALSAAGLRAEAFVSASQLRALIATTPGRAPDRLYAADGRFLGNPTHWYWRECLQQLGMPYVKRDLLQRRRGLAELTDGWRGQLQDCAPGYPLQLIDEVLPTD